MKISRFFFLAAALVFLVPGAIAQQRQIVQPDCVIDFVFTAAAQTAGGSGTCGNNLAGVYEWRITYKSTGFSALSLLVQSAPDSSGAPGTWVNFAGTVTGSNPNTTTTQNSTEFTGFYPWVRVLLSSVTGTGTITGELYGCRQPGCSIAGVSISATIPTPVPVDGPTAAGSPPTTPPVLVAGQDGAPGNIRTIKTDSTGQLIPANASSADADGVSNTEATPTGAAGGVLYPRVFNRVFNGTTWDRMVGNTTGLSISNASSALADAISNTENSFTAVGGALIYPRDLGHYFNGTTWDRVRGNTTGAAPSNASSALADALSNTQLAITDNAAAVLYSRIFGHSFNGASWDRNRTASLANFPASVGSTASTIGAGLAEKSARISVESGPAAGSAASASVAANATARHVVDCVSFSAVSTAAVVAQTVTFVVRDGATGAGTVLWRINAAVPVAAATGQQEIGPHSFCGLNLVGTTNTAMTAEFSGGITGVGQTVSMSYYNVN